MYIQRGLSTQAKLISRQLVFFIVTTLLTLATITTVLLALKPSQTAKAITPPDSCFAFNSATGTITNYYDNENNNSANPACPKDVDIPSTIGGVEVKAITGPSTWTGAFQSKQLTSVTIPDSITSIGDYAFYNNQLTTLTIPDGVTTIGDWAFYENQFATLSIPDSVTSIGTSAFSYNQLTALTIPDSVTTIGNTAFSYNQLTTIIVQGSPATLGTNVVSGSPLTTVTYNGTTYSNPSGPSTPPDSCFTFNASTGSITNYNTPDLADFKAANTKTQCLEREVIIPGTIGGAEVKAITGPNTYTGAFQSKVISSVTVPDTVTTIGNRAFRYSQLANLHLGSSVTAIGEYAFESNQLTSLSIPDSVVTIGDRAFSSNQLNSLTLGSGLTSIGAWTFYTNKLERVTIPSNITSIAPSAFILQNTAGANITQHGPPYYIWSDDPVSVQDAYDSIWYVALYTEDPSNPAGLQPAIVSEGWLSGDDYNNNGHMNDPVGGHLINPARITVNYIGSSNGSLAQPMTYFGQNQDGSYITSYLARANLFPAPLDPDDLTPEELSAVQTGLARYFSPGQTITLDTPTIDGYITPEPTSRTFTLSANPEENHHNIVYLTQAEVDVQNNQGTTSSTGTTTSGGLASTGTSTWIVIGVGAASILAAVGILVVKAARARARRKR